jgi:hypothetical protein
MKLTLEIHADLFKQAKATAAIRGESLKDFVTEALRAHVERRAGGVPTRQGWRSVFGQAQREEVESVDKTVAEEFKHIDPNEWR